jgi:hypothetical protein
MRMMIVGRRWLEPFVIKIDTQVRCINKRNEDQAKRNIVSK